MNRRRATAAIASGLLTCGVLALIQPAPALGIGGQLFCDNNISKPPHAYQCSVFSSSTQEAWTINGTQYPYYNGQWQITVGCTVGSPYRVDVSYVDSAGQPQTDTWSDYCGGP